MLNNLYLEGHFKVPHMRGAEENSGRRTNATVTGILPKAAND